MAPHDPAAPPFAPTDGLLTSLQALRRELHRIPEVGLELPLTQQRILDELDGLDLEITRGTGTTSVVAVLRGGRPGPAVLLRGDMDALPITEQTGLEFASANGAMHACGHDLHVAGLIGAVRLLASRRDELPGDVVFMFQPGEEGYDGAGVMLREGVLEAAGRPLAAAYGVHVGADTPRDRISIRSGTLMAAYAILDVRVIGKGGHGSRPFEARDPIPAAAEMVTALQTHVTRRTSVFDPVVVTVGEFHAGSAPNIIPGEARFRAGVRTFSAEAVEQAERELPELVRGIAAAHGLETEVTFREIMPATVNDPGETEHFLAVARDLPGERAIVELEEPRTGSEDFSRVLAAVPGAYGFLGAGPEAGSDAEAFTNHSPFARFDDAVLADQAVLLATLAWRRLERG